MPIDSMTVPAFTSNAKEQMKTYQGDAIQGVFSFTTGQDVPSNSHRIAVIASGGAAAQIAVTPDTNYELAFQDGTSAATVASGTPDAVIIKLGATTAAATITTFNPTSDVTDRVHPAQSYPILRIHIPIGIVSLGLATTSGGSKSLRVSITRIN